MPFFNLLGAEPMEHDETYFGSPASQTIATNWRTFQDQPLTSSNIVDLVANRIPVIRHEGFLKTAELERMLEVVKLHQLEEYDTEFTWPRVGIAGITQYDHIRDPSNYFRKLPEAMTLQRRWKCEANIDILERVMTTLSTTSGMLVRRASENEKNHFAGILRAMDRGIGVHADFAPYEAAGWSIDQIVGQLTWNILLNKVSGGDTIIYDRQWRTPDDDVSWRKPFPRDSYQPQMLEGHPFKAMRAVPGDLTLFNSRNFHEVNPCDIDREHPVADVRFTISSFVGYMPSQDGGPATLVLWS
ncbi:hypothetical protein ACHAPI_007449 [Fusarium lateritium]